MSKSVCWRTKKLNDELVAVHPEICVERARIVTESYKETEGQPMIIRRAKAMKKLLSEMTIFIQEDQLIVGAQASKLRSSPIFPETEAHYVRDEIDLFEKREQDRLIVPKEVRRELLEDIIPYWENKTIQDYVYGQFPEDLMDVIKLENQIFSVDIHVTGSIGHVVSDYDRILKLGFGGMKKMVEKKQAQLDLTQPDAIEKNNFYEAEKILCDSMILWGKRYAKLAAEMAEKEEDPRRKKEYEMIADICSRVPEHPAKNFREAIQSFWFAHCMLYMEQNGLAVSVGRFDQFMYPYYKASMDQGLMTQEEAQELLECLWVKFTEIMRAYNYECAKYYAGFSISENLVVGGCDENGKCSVNELSYMCLDAEDHTTLPQPNISFRYCRDIPKDFLYRAVEVVSKGRTKPEFFNDEVAMVNLMNDGVTMEDARDYSISGCVEPVPPHCNGETNAAMSNIGKALEFALNDGKDRLNGKQVGPKTGDPRDFQTIDDVLDAFRVQVEWYVEKMVEAINIIEKVHALYYPLPYFSLLMDNCCEEGLDITAGGAKYNFTGPQAVGFADCANSLAAIEKMVFEDKKLTMGQLVDALDTNFEGNEVLRQTLIHKVPKWGNDDDFVDQFGVKVADIYCQAVSKYKNTRGGKYRPGIYSVSGNVPTGMAVGATPNGRFAKSPLADGIGVQHGTDQKGPNAITRSCCKLNHESIGNGTILNEKFTPKLLEDRNGKEALCSLIKTYFEQGGWHIQFNVVSAEDLRKAQEDPETHKGMIIRVAGYSAFFVELDKAVQDDIIQRTEHTGF